MSAFVTDLDFVTKKLQIEAKYDLHGVVNHYGTLGFGHYVSFTRNPFDRKWYKYDDTEVSELDSPSDVKSPKAYILFYSAKN